MNDTQVEQVIQAKSLNVAPRVTKEHIDALMARVVYLFNQPEGTTSTLAHAFLDGTFLLATGHSACVSPDNFNAELGRSMAQAQAEEKARGELWKLEGYALRAKLADAVVASGGKYLPHQQRVIDEKAELDKRRSKLAAFMRGPGFFAIPNEDQILLDRQAGAMRLLSGILGERIERF